MSKILEYNNCFIFILNIPNFSECINISKKLRYKFRLNMVKSFL